MEEIEQTPKPKRTRKAPTQKGRKVLTTYSDEMPVAMTHQELYETGLRLAGLHEEEASLLAKEKQVKAELKAVKEAVKAKSSALALRLNLRTKMAQVEILVEADFEEGVRRHVRSDTKEEVKTEPLLPTDRQDLLELTPEPEDQF